MAAVRTIAVLLLFAIWPCVVQGGGKPYWKESFDHIQYDRVAEKTKQEVKELESQARTGILSDLPLIARVEKAVARFVWEELREQYLPKRDDQSFFASFVEIVQIAVEMVLGIEPIYTGIPKIALEVLWVVGVISTGTLEFLLRIFGLPFRLLLGDPVAGYLA